jgi:hypothetical protein
VCGCILLRYEKIFSRTVFPIQHSVKARQVLGAKIKVLMIFQTVLVEALVDWQNEICFSLRNFYITQYPTSNSRPRYKTFKKQLKLAFGRKRRVRLPDRRTRHRRTTGHSQNTTKYLAFLTNCPRMFHIDSASKFFTYINSEEKRRLDLYS